MVKTAPSEELHRFCGRFLPNVSRTFALTIPVLRGSVRDEVGLAYLLCRIVDTIEDHPSLLEADRNHYLNTLLEVVQGQTPWSAVCRGLPSHPHVHYQELLNAAETAFDFRTSLPTTSSQAVNQCLLDMIRGMLAFPGLAENHVVPACRDLAELDAYCHAAAGTVGILLTHLFSPHISASWLTDKRLEQGRRFGLGLQITNVLKDRNDDDQRGVRYLPPLPLVEVADRGLAHLRVGAEYILSIPESHPDFRLFCLIPLALAFQTTTAQLRGQSKLSKNLVLETVEQAQSAVLTTAGLDKFCREIARPAFSETAHRRSKSVTT